MRACSGRFARGADRNCLALLHGTRAAVGSRMTLRLALSMRDAVLRTYAFEKERITIGRLPTCDVVVENLALSREHAAITRDHGEWVVRDLGSRNGVFVNGQQKPAHALASGDVIGLGKFSLTVTLEAAPARGLGADSRAATTPPVRATPWTQQGAPMPAWLVIKRGEPTGVFSLERDVFSVGGHRSCELRLSGALTPRRVAMIVRGLGGYGLVNVSSRAEAVWRNGKPIPDRCWLEDGDRLEFQDVLARFSAVPVTAEY